MPFAIQNLPVIQNYDCHACGNCCTDYWVPVSEEERKRIEGQGWEKEPEFQGVALFQKYGKWWRPKYRLTQKEGDRCIFLSDQGRCRIHEKFGLEAKPFACRLYPYILVPNGDHWRVSMRFACPSAVANKGRPLTVQTDELTRMAKEMEVWGERPALERNRGPGLGNPPTLQAGQSVTWEDLHLFVNALLAILKDEADSMPRRMLRCLALARFCRQANFEKISGRRLREFLDLARTAVNVEVPRDLHKLPCPGRIGRVLFRTTLSAFLRKDQGSRRGFRTCNIVTLRFALMGAMARIVRGKGPLPPLQIGLPEKTFEDFEAPLGGLVPPSLEALERYYVIKTESLQFCGPSYYGLPFWAGLESLASTLPMICWLARGYRELGQPEAVYKAISVIDEHFGYNPRLGQVAHRLGVRILAFRQELDRLIAWYAR